MVLRVLLPRGRRGGAADEGALVEDLLALVLVPALNVRPAPVAPPPAWRVQRRIGALRGHGGRAHHGDGVAQRLGSVVLPPGPRVGILAAAVAVRGGGGGEGVPVLVGVASAAGSGAIRCCGLDVACSVAAGGAARVVGVKSLQRRGHGPGEALVLAAGGLAAALLDLPADRLQDRGEVAARPALRCNQLVHFAERLSGVLRVQGGESTHSALVNLAASLPLQPPQHLLDPPGLLIAGAVGPVPVVADRLAGPDRRMREHVS
mmetsp:Transcript_26507/g.74033  ORF Transcript_26507/g.74033 Transcript_26507/m.74033 type:complete len:262 (+) Transcript_26507:1126-1911(+)